MHGSYQSAMLFWCVKRASGCPEFLVRLVSSNVKLQWTCSLRRWPFNHVNSWTQVEGYLLKVSRGRGIFMSWWVAGGQNRQREEDLYFN